MARPRKQPVEEPEVEDPAEEPEASEAEESEQEDEEPEAEEPVVAKKKKKAPSKKAATAAAVEEVDIATAEEEFKFTGFSKSNLLRIASFGHDEIRFSGEFKKLAPHIMKIAAERLVARLDRDPKKKTLKASNIDTEALEAEFADELAVLDANDSIIYKKVQAATKKVIKSVADMTFASSIWMTVEEEKAKDVDAINRNENLSAADKKKKLAALKTKEYDAGERYTVETITTEVAEKDEAGNRTGEKVQQEEEVKKFPITRYIFAEYLRIINEIVDIAVADKSKTIQHRHLESILDPFVIQCAIAVVNKGKAKTAAKAKKAPAAKKSPAKKAATKAKKSPAKKAPAAKKPATKAKKAIARK